MDKQFEVLPHSADLKIKVFGKTKEELFKNALKAMAEAMANQELRIQNQEVKNIISVESVDISALLADFLSEVLYQSQVNMAIYSDVKFLKFGDTDMKAEISGNKVKSFSEDIKAVTYHQLEIKKTHENSFETIIIFDI